LEKEEGQGQDVDTRKELRILNNRKEEEAEE